MNELVVNFLISQKGSSTYGKRIFDLIFSCFFLIFLSPLLLFISLLIFIPTKGKIFYVQERLGFQGKVFKCLKFRTMCFNADEKLKEILKQNEVYKKEWREKQKLTDDPRVFIFGKFLRKTSLDELPQLWNVIKGELSLVGPRPYMTNQYKEMGSFSSKILSIRPGLTGLWQTSGRSQKTFKERVFLDATYVDKRSFLYDLLLILKTVPIVIFAKDAC